MKKILCSTLTCLFLTTPLLTFADTNEDVQMSNVQEAIEQIEPRAQYGEISENNVHIRAQAGLSGTILGQLHKGQFLTILTDEGFKYVDGYTWYKVRAGSLVGWVANKYITIYG